MKADTTLPPPPTVLDKGGGDWNDNNFLHYIERLPDGTKKNSTLCGVEGDYNNQPEATPQQLKTMPVCPVCLSLAKYDGRWRLE